MRTFGLGLALAALLSACGPSGDSKGQAPSAEARHVDACALIADPSALFGAGAEAIDSPGYDAMAGVCQWQSADGRRGGDLIIYTAASLGAVAAPAQLATLTESWDATTETPLEALEGIGDEAQLATELPGYQAQIAFRKGDIVVAIAARSGDPAINDVVLATRMAQAAAGGL